MIRASITSPLAAYALSGFCSGHVHSVFSSSFNVGLEGELVHVGRSDALLSCTGASVPSDAMAGLLAGLRAGDVAVARGGSLRLYKRSGTEVIDVRGVPVADCSVPRISLDDAAWALDVMAPARSACTTGLPADGRTAAHLAALSAPDPSPKAVLAAARHLTGRGAGLTPAGDDLLLGYACALKMTGALAASLEALAVDARGLTTDVSLSYAEAFKRGWVNPVYASLARAASRRDREGMLRAIDAVTGIGHTSGADALLGMAIGFSRACSSCKGSRRCSPSHDRCVA